MPAVALVFAKDRNKPPGTLFLHGSRINLLSTKVVGRKRFVLYHIYFSPFTTLLRQNLMLFNNLKGVANIYIYMYSYGT